MSPLLCPACGSTEIFSSEDVKQLAAPFGPPVNARCVTNLCRTCGEEGDFEGVNDGRMSAARADSIKESIPKILAALAGVGLSMAYIERALELPARTVARWKAGDVSAAAVALLRIVAMFPWVLEVAERGFMRSYANAVVIKEGAKILHASAEERGALVSGHVVQSGNFVNLQVTAKVPLANDPLFESKVSMITQGT